MIIFLLVLYVVAGVVFMVRMGSQPGRVFPATNTEMVMYFVFSPLLLIVAVPGSLLCLVFICAAYLSSLLRGNAE